MTLSKAKSAPIIEAYVEQYKRTTGQEATIERRGSRFALTCFSPPILFTLKELKEATDRLATRLDYKP